MERNSSAVFRFDDFPLHILKRRVHTQLRVVTAGRKIYAFAHRNVYGLFRENIVQPVCAFNVGK